MNTFVVNQRHHCKLAWRQNETVARVLVGIVDADKAAGMMPELAKMYGSGDTQGTVTKWHLPNGVTARLDLGTAAALVVEGPAAMAGATPTSPTPSASK